MGNPRLSQHGSDGQLSRLHHIVGGSKDCVYLIQHGADRGNDLVRGVAGLLNIGDALGVQVFLGVLNSRSTVYLRGGVQQTHGFDLRILGQHHIQQQLYIQRVTGAGDVGNASQFG